MGLNFSVNSPMGNADYGPLIVRLAVGGYFLLAGLEAMDNIQGLIEEIQNLGVLPDHLATVYAILVPYISVIIGGMLLLGFWTTLAGFVGSLVALSMIYLTGLFPHTSILYSKDVLLFAGSISLCFSGPGAGSIDRFRSS